MKKRNFLIPVISLIAVISTNASATVQESDTNSITSNSVEINQDIDLVITNSTNLDNAQKHAYHFSHRSHQSHHSHFSGSCTPGVTC